MEKSGKSMLAEYCQKKNLPSPNYRVRQEIGAPNQRRFQVEVEINGRWYTGSENCPSKREAEHSAAGKACRDLMRDSVSVDHQEVSSTDPEINEEDSTKHFPPEYADIENCIVSMLAPFGGRIRKVRPRNSRGMILVEISGRYRYCHKIKRDHTHNQVYFLVDPRKRIYYQRCHDPECRGYQSAEQLIYSNSTNIM